MLHTEAKNQSDISLDNNDHETEKLDNSPGKNLDTGSKTTQVLSEISETNNNSVLSTFLEENNKYDSLYNNPLTAQNPRTEEQALVQSSVSYGKIDSKIKAPEVDIPLNPKLQQYLNEKTDSSSVSVDLSNNNDGIDKVNVKEINQQYPSCSESDSTYSKENFDQKDLTQCVDISELDDKINIPEKDMKADVFDSKLHLSRDNPLSEAKICTDMSEKIEEDINHNSVNSENLHDKLKTRENFDSIHTSFSEIEATNKTAETVSMNSIQKKRGESIENLVSQTSKNISSPSYLPGIPLNSSNISDLKTKNYVTLPIKNILGETLNVVINDDIPKTSVSESERSLKTFCEAELNFTQISNSESINCIQSSTVMDSLSEKIRANESSSALLNKSDCNESSQNCDKTPKCNDICIYEEVSLKESHNKSKTDAVFLNDSQSGDIINKSKDNVVEFTELLNEKIIRNSTQNCGKLLETSSDQISEKRSKENITNMTKLQSDAKIETGFYIGSKSCDISHKGEKNVSMGASSLIGSKTNVIAENYAESTVTFVDKMTQKLTKMTELQSDMETDIVPVVDGNINNSINSFEENVISLNNPQNDRNAENISQNEAKSCDIFTSNVTQNAPKENVTVLTESHDEIAVENNSQITSKICDFHVDTAKESKSVENTAIMTECQNNEFVKNIHQNKDQSLDIPAEKVIEKAPNENASVFNESENDVKSRNDSPLIVQTCFEACDKDPEYVLKKKTEPQNNKIAKYVSQSDDQKIFEECASLSESEDKIKLKNDLQADSKNYHVSADTVTKNVSQFVFEPTSSQIDLNVVNVSVKESKTCDVSINTYQEKTMDDVVGQMTSSLCADYLEKGNMKHEQNSQIDFKKPLISGDTIIKNVSTSISEPMLTLDEINAKMTFSPSYDMEDEYNLSRPTSKTSPEKIETETALNDSQLEACTSKIKLDFSLNSPEKIEAETVSNDSQLKEACTSKIKLDTSLNSPEKIEAETVLNDSQLKEACTSKIKANSSLDSPEKFEAETVSNDSQLKEACTSKIKADSTLNSPEKIEAKTVLNDLEFNEACTSKIKANASLDSPEKNEAKTVSNDSQLKEAYTSKSKADSSLNYPEKIEAETALSDSQLEACTSKIKLDSSLNSPEKIEAKTVSNNSQLKEAYTSKSKADSTLNSPEKIEAKTVSNDSEFNEACTSKIKLDSSLNSPEKIGAETVSNDSQLKEACTSKIKANSSLDSPEKNEAKTVSNNSQLKEAYTSKSKADSSLDSLEKIEAETALNDSQLEACTSKIKLDSSLDSPGKIEAKTVSNDSELKETCTSKIKADSSPNVLEFKNSVELTKETKLIFNKNSHHSFVTSPLKNVSKFMHSEYIPHFCKNKDYVSFSDISLRNKGKQIVADSCLKSPIAITNFPSAATVEIFCEYRNGIVCSTKDVLPLEDVGSKRSKSPSVSSIASDASKSPCVSSIASDEEIEIPHYSSAEEDLLVNDRENMCQKESVQSSSDTAYPSVLLDNNKDCNTNKIHCDSKNDSSPVENIKSLEPSYDSSSPTNQNVPNVPEEESEKLCPRQSLRLKNKIDIQNKTDFSKDTESGIAITETPTKSAEHVPHNFPLKKCSVLCDNLPIKSPSSTNSVPSSPQSIESCPSSQKSVSKKILKSEVKLKAKKFISPKKPYSLRHQKSKQICDNSSNLDIDLSKLQLDSPSCRKNTRSRAAKDAKFAELLASKIDALKKDDGNDLIVHGKRETRSSAAKTEHDAGQNTPGYNLRNRKSIIAPSKLKI